METLGDKENGKKWQRYMKEIPGDNYFLTLSCILGAFYPAAESMIPRLYKTLGINWGTNPSTSSGWTCCTAIAYHGDVMTIEGTLLTIARLWSIAQEMGYENVTPSCVTSFGLHNECKELYEEEPGLKEKVDRWLYEACGRTFEIPKSIIHVSDVVYHYRETLSEKFLKYRLVEKDTGRPLRVVDHVGCHYSKLFPGEIHGRRLGVLRGAFRPCKDLGW